MTAAPRTHTTLLLSLTLALWGVGGCSKRGGSADVLDNNGVPDAGGSTGGVTAAGGGGRLETGTEQRIVGADGRELCVFTEADLLAFDAAEGPRGSSAAAVAGEMALAFQQPDGALSLLAVPPAGAIGAPVTVLPADASISAPQLVATDGQLLLLWQTPSAAARRLWARSLDDAAAAPVSIANLPAANGAPGLAGHSADYVVAFLADGDAMPRVARLDGLGAPTGDPVELAASPADSAGRVELARLDDGQTLVGWLERTDADDFQVMGQVLDGALGAVGDAQVLSGGPVMDAPFSLSGRAGSAGLIYRARELEREAIKFRRVNNDGSVDGPLLNIVPAPGRALDGAIAPFGQGYAVAYRALPSPGVTVAEIHLAFIDRAGQVVYDAVLAESSEQGGPLALAATAQGNLVVTWRTLSGAGMSTTATQAAHRLYCPGALVLCGGSPE